MHLLDENRSLIHAGKVLRQLGNGIRSRETEVFVILFDNYLVMTTPQEKEGVTKYHVNQRPIPLDLVTLVNFTDPSSSAGLPGDHHDLNTVPSVSYGSAGASRVVYPFTVYHHGRRGGTHVLFAESAQARTEWKQKLEQALGIHAVNRVFELETLSEDVFLVPSDVPASPPNQYIPFTGKVTCSIPFNTADGRGLVAIGCAEGLWIGFRRDPRSLRRVLHLKMVTQCVMLDTFGICLVLADKSLFAYHIEALVPSSSQSHVSSVPQELNGAKNVHFFSVGMLHNRTLVIFAKKKGRESVFRVLQPVADNINASLTKVPAGLGSRFGFRLTTSKQWFRVYRDFFLPFETFDIYFLRAHIAITCTKGFEIMDLEDFKSVTIPMRNTASLDPLSQRLDACRPIGMFRSNDDEFLLCYNGRLQCETVISRD
ncbi:CNH domain-containing protein [Mycena epipterygia]|nr:CNH domain-containing protein [Mycena epipterygia]